MQYICSKTGDEGNIYAARQGMRACNNNNMRNPIIKEMLGGVTHVIIVACPHPLSCCIYVALMLHIYCTCFFTFWYCHPYILMEMFLLPCFTGFSLHTRLQIQCSLRLCEPHPLCCSCYVSTYVMRKWRSTTRKC